MRSASKLKLGLLLVGLCIGLSSMYRVDPLVYSASQNTEIKAEICNNAAPVVTVTHPQSDSVTNDSLIALAGKTERTSQIDISLNDLYSQSVAIGANNTFATTISLQEGINTIALDAYYSCNQQSKVFTIVVTYAPGGSSSNGGDSNTEVVKPGNTVPGIISNPRAPATNLDYDFVIPLTLWWVYVFLLLLFVIVLPPYLLVWLCAILGIQMVIERWHRMLARLVAAAFVLLFVTILVHV